MKNNWQTKKLGELFEITSSKRVFKSEWKNNGVPFYRAREIVKLAKQGFVNNELFISEEMYSQYSKKYGIPKENDIMITGVGTLGICYVVQKNDKFYFKDGNIIWLKNQNNINSRFVEYAFQSDFFREKIDDTAGATVGTFTIIKAKNMLIGFPEIQEQGRIVKVLDGVFEKIEKAKKNTEKNLQNSRELLESYLNNIFTIPGKDWEEKELESLTSKIGSGATPRGGKESYIKEGISLVRSMNVHDRNFVEKNLAFIDDKQAKDLLNVTLKKGDVLLNITGASVARSCVFPDKYLPARVNQHVSIIRPRQEIIDSTLLNYLLTSKFYKDRLLTIGGQGSTRQAITKAQLEEFTVSFPQSIPQQKSIVTKLDRLSSETKKMETIYKKKLTDLEELKKSILSKAFAGEL